MERFRDLLEATPGLHITEIEREGNVLLVRGLRDPLATTVSEVAVSEGIPESSLRVSMRPYQSLDPAIIEARARQLFGGAENVEFQVSGNTLIVSGEASLAWQRALQARYGQLGGVLSLDMRDVTDGADVTLAQRAAALSGRSFVFERDTVLAPDQDEALRTFAVELGDLAKASDAAGRAIEVIVTGATDALGTTATNRQLARRRAEVVASALANAGLRPVIGAPDIPDDGAAVSSDENRRLARVAVRLLEEPASP